jgi:Terminase large subunit, T4likevirus-type, N-terminal/Terminase RNaseH-like domain
MLKISRSDIDCEEITEFDVNDRFIKLPIDRYLQLLPAPAGGGTVFENLNRPQIALINAINSPKYRFVCAALARRLGKTYISNIIAQMVLLIPNLDVLIISPNYSLSSISFELQRKLIYTFDLEIVRDNLKDRVLELSNGSSIRLGSVGQVDSCVGRSYQLILFDEAALSADGEAAFNVSLRPTLDRPNSKAIFISTPRGKKNWFSRFYARGYSSEFPEWCSIVADYRENERMSERDVQEARNSMSAAEFEQEYMASFNTYEGQIYALSTENVVEQLPPGKYEYFAGMDPGYRDPTAFVVLAYDTERDIFYVVDDYLEAEKSTSSHATAIKEMLMKHPVDSIFIDPAAAQFAADLAYQYDIATIGAKKAVLEGIAYCQTIVQQDRLKVLSHCNHVLDAFDQYQWDPNESLIKEKPLHNDASHIADAVRYALYTFTI